MFSIFNCHTYLGIIRNRPGFQKTHHSLRAFRKHLKGMMRRLFHHLKHLPDEIVRDVFVKKIAHGIDEIHGWFSTHKGFIQSVGVQRKGKPTFISLDAHGFQAASHDFRITVLTTRRHLRTTGCRVPSLFCPFYFCTCTHNAQPESQSLAPASDDTRTIASSLSLTSGSILSLVINLANS